VTSEATLPSGAPPAARAEATPLAGASYEALGAEIARIGLPASHALRVVRACVRGGGTDFARVSNVGPRQAALLNGVFTIRASCVVASSASADGTTKLLVEVGGGDVVESVLMRLARRNSGCLSSQVGCAAACAFCASGLAGLRRSLAPWEIVEQAWRLRDEARARGERLDHLVFMGMGEPMHAYASVVTAIRLLTDPRLSGFGPSRITVSTVGVVPGIEALAEEGLGVHLAVSLHAADDALRASLLPTASRFGVARTLEAAERFRVRTGRFVTLQVTLLHGVNDGVAHATSLAAAVDGRPFHVNLIPVNPVEGLPYVAPPQEAIDAFLATLRARGVVAHVRARRGADVDAACGQLRRRASGSAPVPARPLPA
jgi:23S rRNA (adenine2503-C2)-methyltransferase